MASIRRPRCASRRLAPRHLARDGRALGTKRFGSEGDAIEELVAELGAAFLCADLDLTLEPREDHAAYISNWLNVLTADNRAISRQPATRSARRTSSTACSRRPPPANYRPWHPERQRPLARSAIGLATRRFLYTSQLLRTNPRNAPFKLVMVAIDAHHPCSGIRLGP